MTDFPGHARLRGELPPYLKKARGILFMVDASDISEETLREIAELLYDVLAGCIRAGNEPKVLIICNKQDLADVASTKEIKRLLEKEL